MAKVKKRVKRRSNKDSNPEPTPEEQEQSQRFLIVLGVSFVIIVALFAVLQFV